MGNTKKNIINKKINKHKIKAIKHSVNQIISLSFLILFWAYLLEYNVLIKSVIYSFVWSSVLPVHHRSKTLPLFNYICPTALVTFQMTCLENSPPSETK